jgi:hypothetical protein
MPLRRLTSRVTVLRMACAAFGAIVADAPGAEVLSLISADGIVIETNKLSPSTRFVGALAIWVQNSYAISIDCRPPRGCYAKIQVINYHFSCAPRYVIVGERISMDLNGNVVKHEVLEPAATSGLDYDAHREVLERFCGPVPDPADLPRRQAPEPGEKPRKGS